jgi:hypothetical protein
MSTLAELDFMAWFGVLEFCLALNVSVQASAYGTGLDSHKTPASPAFLPN